MNLLGLFKAKLKNKTTIEATLEKTVDSWEIDFYKDRTEEEWIKHIRNEVEYSLQKKLAEKVIEKLEIESDKLIDGLVKELLENFDFKKPILDVMQMQCKEYLINNKNKYGRY